MSNFKSDNPDPAKGTPATDTPFQRDNPDPAKGTPATDTPFQRDNPDPAKGTPVTEKEPKKDDPQKDDPKKDAGIFAGCLASLCCCFAAEEHFLDKNDLD